MWGSCLLAEVICIVCLNQSENKSVSQPLIFIAEISSSLVSNIFQSSHNIYSSLAVYQTKLSVVNRDSATFVPS